MDRDSPAHYRVHLEQLPMDFRILCIVMAVRFHFYCQNWNIYTAPRTVNGPTPSASMCFPRPKRYALLSQHEQGDHQGQILAELPLNDRVFWVGWGPTCGLVLQVPGVISEHFVAAPVAR